MDEEIKLNELEKAVMEMILKGDNPEKKILLEQWKNARIISREYSGKGFFLNLDVPDAVPKIENRTNLTVDDGDIIAHVPGVKHDIGFALFVRDGKLKTLEGYTFADDWPTTISEFKLERVGFGVSHH